MKLNFYMGDLVRPNWPGLPLEALGVIAGVGPGLEIAIQWMEWPRDVPMPRTWKAYMVKSFMPTGSIDSNAM